MTAILLAQNSPIPLTDWALDGLFDGIADACFRCNEALMPIAYTLAFAGLLLKAFGVAMGDISGVWKHLMMMGVVAVLLPSFPDIIVAAQTLFGVELLAELEMDPVSIVESFFTRMVENIGDVFTVDFSSVGGVLGVFNPLEYLTKIMEVIGNVIMVVLAVIAYVLILFAYIVQILILYIGLAAAPIFIGMLMWDTTRETGTKYIMGLIGITFWPLGWGLGLIFLDAILLNGELGLLTYIITLIPILGGLLEIILILVAVVWILVTVFYAPKIVSKAITTGIQIGSGMVGEAIGMSTATAGAAIGAAATVGGAAAGAAIGGPAGAAIGGSIGGAAGGAAGGVVSSAGNAARPDS